MQMGRTKSMKKNRKKKLANFTNCILFDANKKINDYVTLLPEMSTGAGSLIRAMSPIDYK